MSSGVNSPDLPRSSASSGGEPSIVRARFPDGEPKATWDIQNDVLTTKSFPATCILRSSYTPKSRNKTCSCGGTEVHRTFFDVCRSVIAPCLKKGLDIPEVKVCWNAENLFECTLARELNPSGKRRKFRELSTVSECNFVLQRGTYWFRRFVESKSGSLNRTGTAILRLLAGLRSYSGKENRAVLCSMPLKKSRVNVLRNILATVDGLLMQLVLCFPDRKEYCCWSRIDQIVNCLISLLIADYFRDEKGDISRLTTFEKVKKLRKAVKEAGFSPIGDLNTIDIPREMSFFKTVISFVGMGKRPIDMFRIATLSQTRASGVPPRSVYTKTLGKLKEVLQHPPDPSLYEKLAGFLNFGVDRVHDQVLEKLGTEPEREKFWRNCLDKAKISLSDSGEFFTKTADGGKLEAARKVLNSNYKFRKRSLYNGEIERDMSPESDSVGELLFYWAVDQFADDELIYDRNLMSCRVSLVAELGKYRGITVSHLAHAILLHVLSHVLLEYLRVIPSSESGIKAANHAWNFFKRLSHKNPHANFLFGDKEVYLFSTDWETATDYCDHVVAQAMLNRLCYNLGIPDWYRETCVFALCAPRQVEFIDPEGKTLECFYTQRGVLMGDPVTKVILHLYHLVGRISAKEQIEQTLIACDDPLRQWANHPGRVPLPLDLVDPATA